METSYKNISYFFIGILICVLIGFHQTYTVRFPAFEGLTIAHHFHGLMMMAWFAMLIIQPFLIRYNKIAWHRQIGRLSYLLIPMLLFSIFWVTKLVYYRELARLPKEAVLGGLALDIPDILIFGLFYVLAMVYRKNAAFHMRFMIGTSLLLIGPGLGRAMIIYGGVPFPVAIVYTMYFSEILALLFTIFDYFKGRSVKPFLIILAGLLSLHICWEYQMAPWWQVFASWFAKVFF